MTNKVKIVAYVSLDIHDKLTHEKETLQVSQSAVVTLALVDYFRRRRANGKKEQPTQEEL